MGAGPGLKATLRGRDLELLDEDRALERRFKKMEPRQSQAEREDGT